VREHKATQESRMHRCRERGARSSSAEDRRGETAHCKERRVRTLRAACVRRGSWTHRGREADRRAGSAACRRKGGAQAARRRCRCKVLLGRKFERLARSGARCRRECEKRRVGVVEVRAARLRRPVARPSRPLHAEVDEEELVGTPGSSGRGLRRRLDGRRGEVLGRGGRGDSGRAGGDCEVGHIVSLASCSMEERGA